MKVGENIVPVLGIYRYDILLGPSLNPGPQLVTEIYVQK